MKKIIRSLIIVALIFSLACRQEERDILPFDLAALNSEPASLENSANFQGKVLKFEAIPGRDTLSLYTGNPAVKWSEYSYLVLEVWHDNAFSAILNIDFFKKASSKNHIVEQGGDQPLPLERKPAISPKIGILPGLITQVIFPLSYLDGQDIFLDRLPRQLKGTVLGSRLPADKIDQVRLRLSPAQAEFFQTRLEIGAVYLSKIMPPPLPDVETKIVDSFGQWTARDWPGKIKDEEQLTHRMQSLSEQTITENFPEQWSRYGGWKKKRFEPTGFFYTKLDDQRWWLVDPDGYAFLSMGMDCVRYDAAGVISGQEDLFSWIPPRTDSIYAGCYSSRGDLQMVNFLKSNLIRVFGEKWQEKWENMTIGLLKQMRFNTIGNWSDVELAQKKGFPYVLPMRGFPDTQVKLFRDFPDVYADEFQQHAAVFAQQLEGVKDDPYLIGYFLTNEPHWAFGYHNLAFEMFATDQTSYTKSVFISWLREKYQRDIFLFNQSWNLDLAHFAALASMTFEESPSVTAESDFKSFSEVMVKQYIDVVCNAVEKVDPNHLNLGMRYAWISSDLLYLAGERFDVFSINGYAYPSPPETAEIARRSGKPILIGEFHFGAIDRGLPATGIRGVHTQTDRAKAYRHYLEQGFTRPELIGIHYFQWVDQPVFGRFDGENYNIGFLDICYQPYPEMMEGAKKTHERLYRVANGLEMPYDSVTTSIPAIYY